MHALHFYFNIPALNEFDALNYACSHLVHIMVILQTHIMHILQVWIVRAMHILQSEFNLPVLHKFDALNYACSSDTTAVRSAA